MFLQRCRRRLLVYRCWATDRPLGRALLATQWVEQHGRARLQYLAESWRRRWLQWPTLVSTGLGGLMAVVLVMERVGKALSYLWNYGLLR